jgi:hypothetical protein
MLVIIGPHSLNTLQARVIGMKIYPDDVMGGSTRRRTPLPYTTPILRLDKLKQVIGYLIA